MVDKSTLVTHGRSVGQRGTVTGIHLHKDWTQVDVDWDSGRSLMLSIPPDEIVLETEADQ